MQEVTINKSLSPSNHMLTGIMKYFADIFVSGIIGELEHL